MTHTYTWCFNDIGPTRNPSLFGGFLDDITDISGLPEHPDDGQDAQQQFQVAALVARIWGWGGMHMVYMEVAEWRLLVCLQMVDVAGQYISIYQPYGCFFLADGSSLCQILALFWTTRLTLVG